MAAFGTGTNRAFQVATKRRVDQVNQQQIGQGLRKNPNQQVNSTDNVYDPNIYTNNYSHLPNQTTQNLYSADPDVRLAQTYLNQYYHGGGKVQGMPGTYKEYEAAKNRVALKKALAEGITGAPEQLQKELGLLSDEAGSALTSGLKSTRKNFNDRGLLYSGIRQGGEQQVRGRVASALAQSQSEAQRESANLMDKRKAAFASIGLADQEKKNEMAQLAFENSYRNSIARRQAMQQLAGGVGEVFGAAMDGGSERPANTSDPR